MLSPPQLLCGDTPRSGSGRGRPPRPGRRQSPPCSGSTRGQRRERRSVGRDRDGKCRSGDRRRRELARRTAVEPARHAASNERQVRSDRTFHGRPRHLAGHHHHGRDLAMVKEPVGEPATAMASQWPHVGSAVSRLHCGRVKRWPRRTCGLPRPAESWPSPSSDRARPWPPRWPFSAPLWWPPVPAIPAQAGLSRRGHAGRGHLATATAGRGEVATSTSIHVSAVMASVSPGHRPPATFSWPRTERDGDRSSCWGGRADQVATSSA